AQRCDRAGQCRCGRAGRGGIVQERRVGPVATVQLADENTLVDVVTGAGQDFVKAPVRHDEEPATVGRGDVFFSSSAGVVTVVAARVGQAELRVEIVRGL